MIGGNKFIKIKKWITKIRVKRTVKKCYKALGFSPTKWQLSVAEYDRHIFYMPTERAVGTTTGVIIRAMTNPDNKTIKDFCCDLKLDNSSMLSYSRKKWMAVEYGNIWIKCVNLRVSNLNHFSPCLVLEELKKLNY